MSSSVKEASDKSNVTQYDLIKSVFGLEQIEESIYRGNSPHIGGSFFVPRLFGGQAVSQAFQSVTYFIPHSFDYIHTINYKFIAPGKTHEPITYHVNEEDGVVKVWVKQVNEKIIGRAHCRFSSESDLLDAPIINLPPLIPMASDLPSLDELLTKVKVPRNILKRLEVIRSSVFELRFVELSKNSKTSKMRNLVWARIWPYARDCVPSTQGIAVALLMSDFFIMEGSRDLIQSTGNIMETGASLHHTVHLHQHNIDPYQWFLYGNEVEVFSSERAKIRGYIFDEKVNCVLSVVQEAYCQIRVPRKVKIVHENSKL